MTFFKKVLHSFFIRYALFYHFVSILSFGKNEMNRKKFKIPRLRRNKITEMFWEKFETKNLVIINKYLGLPFVNPRPPSVKLISDSEIHSNLIKFPSLGFHFYFQFIARVYYYDVILYKIGSPSHNFRSIFSTPLKYLYIFRRK